MTNKKSEPEQVQSAKDASLKEQDFVNFYDQSMNTLGQLLAELFDRGIMIDEAKCEPIKESTFIVGFNFHMKIFDFPHYDVRNLTLRIEPEKGSLGKAN